jgi:hypothetical protein
MNRLRGPLISWPGEKTDGEVSAGEIANDHFSIPTKLVENCRIARGRLTRS